MSLCLLRRLVERTRPLQLLLLVGAVPLAAGCCDGTAPVRGKVMVEGVEAGNGRVTFNQVGGGQRAFGYINQSGEVVLRAVEADGVYPGTYRVSFSQKPEGQIKALLTSQGRGLSVDDMTITYEGPKDQLIEITETGDEELVIDIRQEVGWKRYLSD